MFFRTLLTSAIELTANVAIAGMLGAAAYGVLSALNGPEPVRRNSARSRRTRLILAMPQSPVPDLLQQPPFHFSAEELNAYGSN